MDKIMMWVMAICAMIGGVDQLAGNKFGLGRRFEDGFQLLGPTALSMAGLICHPAQQVSGQASAIQENFL